MEQLAGELIFRMAVVVKRSDKNTKNMVKIIG
jgi:hypothetical protein